MSIKITNFTDNTNVGTFLDQGTCQKTTTSIPANSSREITLTVPNNCRGCIPMFFVSFDGGSTYRTFSGLGDVSAPDYSIQISGMSPTSDYNYRFYAFNSTSSAKSIMLVARYFRTPSALK